MSKQSLNGKVVLIAGGAKNLGGLVARDLAASGAAAIVVHYNSDATRAAAEETLKAVNAAGAQAIAVQGDLTKPATWRSCLSRLSRHSAKWILPLIPPVW